MESGSETQYARCRRCHGTFDSSLSNCPRCGLAYVPAAELKADEGSYIAKYQGTEFAEPVAPPPVPGGSRRMSFGLILALGVALIVIAVSVSGLVLMGALDTPATPTPPPIVISRTTPTPAPTMPPAVARTLATISDPKMNLHISIKTSVSVNARAAVNHQSKTSIVLMEVDCENGNESGTITTGNLSTEFRLVGGIYYTRGLPSGKWGARSGMSPFMIFSPMFQLSDPRMLQYDGPDQLSGVMADKLETTQWWTPDTGKMSGLDISTLGVSPDRTKLQIWVDSGGTPLYASFRAWLDAKNDGTNLLNIATTYAFSNVGTVQPIASPRLK